MKNNLRTINLRKFKLIETITSSKDEKVLEALEEVIRKYRITTFESKMNPMTNEQFNNEINKGFKAYQRGEYSSIEDYLKEIEEES